MDTSSSTIIEHDTLPSRGLETISVRPATLPLSTYRLQFSPNFRFEDARGLVPYLSSLGISHCYCSPILKARAGSQHGYDIIDHNQLNPEIGTEEEFRSFIHELKSQGMGLILDIVPNHMGVGHGDNPWWQDVLQNGRTSSYASFFDIDWEPLKPELRNKILIPILGNQYGEELERGNIRVAFNNGRFLVRYFDKRLPVDPQTIPLIFEPIGKRQDCGATAFKADIAAFRVLLKDLQSLPPNSATDPDRVDRRQREILLQLDRLGRLAEESNEVRASIAQALLTINGTPGNSASFDALHRLLEAQAYRLAFWRVSAEEINYRRFFDINDLVGLRMEDPKVFAETHKLIRKFLSEGLITGLRVDHPDGLLNPAQYFTRLQMLYTASQVEGREPRPPLTETGIESEVEEVFASHPGADLQAPLYLLVEKILGPGEELRSDWRVNGSVGYDFANLVNGILIDRRNERHFTRLYQRLTGCGTEVDILIYRSKKLVLQRALSSEVLVLTHLLDEISSQDRRARDFTRSVLREAIRETIACFPVYRTYIDERGQVSDLDRRNIQYAISRAKRRNGNTAQPVFDFLRTILLLEGGDGHASLDSQHNKLYFTLKFQQLTGPVMAKGLEDTACYIYNRFVSVNDVGSSPGEFGLPVSEFHHENQLRAEHWPGSMLSTTTHDTKRSEDVRARLDVLSEMPRDWATQVMKWRRINRNRKARLADGRTVPDHNEEYFLYQTLVGTWPIHVEPAQDYRNFVCRIQQYMEKAVHEAKVNLSWINPNPEYVQGINDFIEQILSPVLRGRKNLFHDSLQKFLPALTYFGAINSLSQALLKLTAPGMPDIYQGQEMWDFSLVDPDNRRPVNFDLRQRALDDLNRGFQSEDPLRLCQELLHTYRDGRIKLWITMCALNFRRDHKKLFQSGSYVPLLARGSKQDHVVAFARLQGDEMAIVAAPRLSYTLMSGREEPPVGTVWGDTDLVLPADVVKSRLRNIFTGEMHRPSGDQTILCREVFAHFPVALFTLG